MLQIRLFGGLDLVGSDGRRPPLPTKSSRNLLAFLALNAGRLHHRDVLAGSLWGDRPDRAARKILRNSLWRLRCALEGEEDATISAEGHSVGLLGAAWIDTREFHAVTSILAGTGGRQLAAAEVRSLEGALHLYAGDLLEGVYEPWTTGPRENLRLTFLTVLERLLLHHRSAGDHLAAIGLGRTLLRHDPFREHVHRELMLCHWAMGDRPLAVRQYQVCEKVLREELEMEPMEETRELHDRIRSGEGPAGAAAPSAGDPSLEGAVSDLYSLAARLSRIRHQRSGAASD